MATRQMLNAAGQAVLLEDLENPWLDDIEGYERFQRTAPAVKGVNGGPIGNHIWAENPRKPNAGKQYMAIQYRYQEYPRAAYRQRVVASRDTANDLALIAKAKDKDRQKLWDDFLDRLFKSELEIDLRLFALPGTVPDVTAIRMLARTLPLQIQSAEWETWRIKNHPKTFQDYQLFVKSPIMRVVYSDEDAAALGRGWFKSPDCAPDSEFNKV